MLELISDNLSRLEEFSYLIPSVVAIVVIFIWLFIAKISNATYKTSLVISILFILLSIPTLLLNFEYVAGIMGEYAFIFMSIGTLQAIFGKNKENQ